VAIELSALLFGALHRKPVGGSPSPASIKRIAALSGGRKDPFYPPHPHQAGETRGWESGPAIAAPSSASGLARWVNRICNEDVS
jgi:hypothetical protein